MSKQSEKIVDSIILGKKEQAKEALEKRVKEGEK